MGCQICDKQLQQNSQHNRNAAFPLVEYLIEAGHNNSYAVLLYKIINKMVDVQAEGQFLASHEGTH